MEHKELIYEITNELPQVTLANIVDIKPPYVHFKRKANEYILYYVISGEMYITQGDHNYVLKEHEFIILDPAFVHVGYKSSVAKFCYIHFTGTLKKLGTELPADFAGISISGYHSVNARECHVNVLSLAEDVIRSVRKDASLSKSMAAASLYKLLLVLAMDMQYGIRLQSIDVKGKIRDVIPQIVTYLDTRYSEDITGASLEAEFNFHFDYMNRQFSKWTGFTIFNYLTHVRITQASQLLSTGYYSTKEVAAMTGFKDVSYFSKVFKKETGTTPGKWV
ncbi:MAG: AraC family transcriptional regulator [Lachnospiraceae bacterium]|nr:AraC family transcriptional regulator [Lachnospiraceae bacterium]